MYAVYAASGTHFNKAALTHEQDKKKKKDELVHFNVAAFLSIRVYQGYALHRILIYFHIIKYWHQRLEIMERSRKLFFSFCLYLFSHPFARLVLRWRQSSRPQDEDIERGDREIQCVRRALIKHSD